MVDPTPGRPGSSRGAKRAPDERRSPGKSVAVDRGSVATLAKRGLEPLRRDIARSARRVRASSDSTGRGVEPPHAEVERYASLVDVFCFPRRPMRLTELVTPLKPLEAMALGRVVLASDVGGHRELIRHGVTGMLYAADEPAALTAAIVDLFEDPGSWPALGVAGRRFVEHHRRWSASVARYVPVYTRLLGPRILGRTRVAEIARSA